MSETRRRPSLSICFLTPLLLDEVVQRMVKKKMLEPGLKDQTRELLLLHHSTLYTRQKRHAKSGQQLHIIRSLAEIGKRHSAKDVNKRE